LTSHDSHSPTA